MNTFENYKSYALGDKICEPRQEGTLVTITSAGIDFYIFFNDPSTKEIDEINNGVAQFKLTVFDDITMFLAKFGTLHWMDAPYNITLDSGIFLDRPTDGSNIGYAMHVYLINARTGTLKVIRLLGLSNRYSIAISNALLAQEPINPNDYYRKLDNLYRKYQTSDLLSYSSASCKI